MAILMVFFVKLSIFGIYIHIYQVYIYVKQIWSVTWCNSTSFLHFVKTLGAIVFFPTSDPPFADCRPRPPPPLRNNVLGSWKSARVMRCDVSEWENGHGKMVETKSPRNLQQDPLNGALNLSI